MDTKMAARWRWELYTLCAMDALFIPLIGGSMEGTAKGIALISSYSVWAALLALFGATFFERTSGFIIQCLYYLFCTAFPLAFFGSFPNIALHLWLPVSSCLGIFVGIALRDCYAHTTKRMRRCIRETLLRWLPAREPLLPVQHRPEDLCLNLHTQPCATSQQRRVELVSKTCDESQSPADMDDCRMIDPKGDI
ncbi:hypothetical protein P171DRAFT_520782 [Karstenula rhodostoma CBS 690.94]|uniref:Uncharacterized protein n=1 Tax=Karstenula rhodostoma CBS 690.94 TaxID=1392251 RepID=A0A9P4PJX3_9PLEO|nr:hypothetical protein P171DRAFT_520782 [Karstenula rhodostoma CBS 690.94]